MEYFPNLIPAILPSYWISGYFSIYCPFDCVVDTGSKFKGAIYSKAVPYFIFSRTGELELIRLLSGYFYGNLNLRGNGRIDVVVFGISSYTTVARLFLVYLLSAPKIVILNLLHSIPSRSGELDSIIYNIFVLSQELKALRDDSQKSSRGS